MQKDVYKRQAVNDDSIWSCLSSMGYDWMVSTGVPQVEDQIEDNTAVIILMLSLIHI